MKHILKLLPIGLLMVFTFTGCHFYECEKGSGETITVDREVPFFNQILLQGNYKLYFSQDTVQYLTIEAEDNILPLINTWVTANDRLVIEMEECIRQHQTIKLYISTPEIKGIEINGSADVIAETGIISSELELAIDGSGSMQLQELAANDMMFKILGSGDIRADNLVATDVFTQIDGSGDVDIQGEALTHEISILGSGDVRAYDLIVDTYAVEIDGSGDCRISVITNLDVHIRGSGSVFYKGDPEVLAVVIDGSGEVVKVE